jgi:hypothetical protein
VLLKVDEALNSVSLGETLNETFSMLIRARDDVVRHADVKRAIWLVAEDVGPIAHNGSCGGGMDPGSRPG